jgi:ubiquinone/menaquinone biosynthesis C-methylase UbiE
LSAEYTIAETAWFPWVADHLPLKPGDQVLDVGCGPAWFWAAIARMMPAGIHLTLADLSPGMVEEAIERCSSLPFGSVTGRTADAGALPFEDARFNGVIAMHMLYHLPDPAIAVAEMFRVLKPGGFLAITTNGADNMRKMYELTTAFGGTPYDPAAAVFGYEAAERLMRAQFGNATFHEHPARMRVTEPEDVFLALTSYPPGDRASDAQIAAFKAAIDAAFTRGGGALEVEKETGLFVAIKP